MALETGTYISDLVITNPVVSDGLVEGDDHLRLIKSTLKSTFPNVTGAVNPTQTELNYVVGASSALQTQITSASTLATAALPKATVPNVVATMNASSAELNYSVGVTSLIQTQLNTHTTNITTAQTTANNALPKAGGTMSGPIAMGAFKITGLANGVAATDAATVGQLISYSPTIRQTVATGPVDTAGLPSFLPATSASLSITSQNVTSSAPLLSTAAQGANSSGQVNVTNIASANRTWGPVTANVSNYLYVNASTGATGFTTLVPIYQYGGTPVVTNGQFTFNYSEMQGYMGNGTTAPSTPLVFVGEVVAGATTITSTIAYVYNGYYDSGFTAGYPAATTVVTKNSNMGGLDVTILIIAGCTTADIGYSVGDQVIINPTTGTTAAGFLTSGFSTRNTVGFITSSSSTSGVGNKGTAANATFTLASWQYKITAKRSW